MSKTPLLFRLPHAWFVAFISEWLDMPSVGKLDTAISSKEYRSHFLNSLQSMRSTSVDEFADSRGYQILGGNWTGRWWRWLSVRQIHVESISLRENDVRSDLVIPSTQKVSALYFEDEDLRYLVLNCPSLRSLNLRSCSTLSNIGILTNLHQSLEEFFYRRQTSSNPEDYYTQTAAALIDVLRRCIRLREVSLTGDALRSVNLGELLPYGHLFHELHFTRHGRTIASAQAISNLFSNCSKLRKLRYGSSDAEQDSLFFTAIHQSCPLLEELQLSSFSFDQSQVAGAAVFTLINRNCTHLRKLTFLSCKISTSILRNVAGMEALKELTLHGEKSVTDAVMAVVSTMKLDRLFLSSAQLTGGSLQSFVGSNISQTLESFQLSARDNMAPIDDVQFATALASCHNLKTLYIYHSDDGCLFGRNGLDGLQAMAAGCPLLADVFLSLTVSGIHYLGTHFQNLKRCRAVNTCAAGTSTPPEGYPSIEELQTLYPAVKWNYFV
jgi:hypothetical protein